MIELSEDPTDNDRLATVFLRADEPPGVRWGTRDQPARTPPPVLLIPDALLASTGGRFQGMRFPPRYYALVGETYDQKSIFMLLPLAPLFMLAAVVVRGIKRVSWTPPSWLSRDGKPWTWPR